MASLNHCLFLPCFLKADHAMMSPRPSQEHGLLALHEPPWPAVGGVPPSRWPVVRLAGRSASCHHHCIQVGQPWAQPSTALTTCWWNFLERGSKEAEEGSGDYRAQAGTWECSDFSFKVGLTFPLLCWVLRCFGRKGCTVSSRKA